MKTVFRLASLLRPYWKYLVITLLAALGETAAGLLQPWPLKVVFDNVFRSKQNLPPVITHLVVAVFGSGRLGILYFALAAVLDASLD
jgi:ATP-binding cassette, subfamily B, bacterial